ncbi:hypothetical protein AX15_002429 [Amanita polypyramis BW_CC]|nr:hypothetical protein AX15_002429 [Amanita polypyramis BW_CC]
MYRRRSTQDALIEETIYEDPDDLGPADELKVTFYPPLYLQRRLWVLNIVRSESVAQILDVGCGEGQLLSILCQPAPWLRPPPPTVLPPSPTVSGEATSPTSDTQPELSSTAEEVTYFRPTLLYGFDISDDDLSFAISNTAPTNIEEAVYNANFRSRYASHSIRWEELQAKIWRGGLQTINEAFIDIECIVSMEVIEHLPPDILPAFAPMLLGVYHPHLFLVTTPSYTFNARFNTPDAPHSARRGYPDPTNRTDRIFRHDDHKFEWTIDEFEAWCKSTAEEWGYQVSVSSVGRAVEKDPWERDDKLGGATQVAVFRRLNSMSNIERDAKGREIIDKLGLGQDQHTLLAAYEHKANKSSMKPKSLKEIGEAVKERMERFEVSFIRLEEIWFEHDIAVMCGGWIEYLARAAEESEDLKLNRGDGVRKERINWTIELVGATQTPTNLWPTEGGMSEAMLPPEDWIPEEETSAESSEYEGSTGNEGDISWGCSEDDEEGPATYTDWGFNSSHSPIHWTSDAEEGKWESVATQSKDECSKGSSSASTATAGWEGDQSDDIS